MHTHGTAVLDRPVEATVPAQVLQPALSVVADTLDPEPARSTDDAAKALVFGYEHVRDLTYEELAVALNASGVRSQYFRSADPAQLTEWAAQGLALLGIDRVRWYAYRTRQLNLRPLHSITAQQEAEFRRMWPCIKAFQPCHDAAWRIAFGHRAYLSASLSRSGL
jgi:hypothetical protein